MAAKTWNKAYLVRVQTLSVCHLSRLFAFAKLQFYYL